MIIKQFKSGHPIGSSLDPSGPSGLASRTSSNQGYESFNTNAWPPQNEVPWQPEVKHEWNGQEYVMDPHELEV